MTGQGGLERNFVPLHGRSSQYEATWDSATCVCIASTRMNRLYTGNSVEYQEIRQGQVTVVNKRDQNKTRRTVLDWELGLNGPPSAAPPDPNPAGVRGWAAGLDVCPPPAERFQRRLLFRLEGHNYLQCKGELGRSPGITKSYHFPIGLE
jgi:hypothetical protein